MGYMQGGDILYSLHLTYTLYTNIFSVSHGKLHLETGADPFDSPLPSQRSSLRRDSHILAEISDMETSFTNQEQVSTDSEDDETVDELISHGKEYIITMIDEAFAGINPFDETPEDDPTKQTKNDDGPIDNEINFDELFNMDMFDTNMKDDTSTLENQRSEMLFQSSVQLSVDCMLGSNTIIRWSECSTNHVNQCLSMSGCC